MAESPTKNTKQQIREKRKKIQAFKSFLHKPQPGVSTLQLSNNNTSDHEHQHSQSYYQQNNSKQQNSCIVCAVEQGDHKRFCGFCRNVACNQHMRKKRKSRNSGNKFVRICDNCQDQYLYKKYMKLQLKNQQSIAAQQSIVTAKKMQVQQQLNGRRTKLQLVQNKQNQLLSQEKANANKHISLSNQLCSKQQKLKTKQFQLQKLAIQMQQLESKLPPSLEQDYVALQIQNEKVVKQLVRYQRLCNEAIKSKSKRQKQIYEEYHMWEQNQRNKRKKKEEDDCIIC